MGKSETLNIRLSPEELDKLNRLADKTVRTKTDMVRFLIHQAYEQTAKVESNSQQVAA